MTFGAALRSILRQDPDIIMVGEMRDTETAEIAIRAAITGHLVLSTLHTNDAASTVTRLVDMGVEAYMVATSLIGIVAQRLTKVLCPECKKPRMSTEEENELMGLDHSVQVYDPCGCPKCNNTGYKGRTAIHEILLATPSIQALITRGAKADEIQELAKKEGWHLLRDNVSEPWFFVHSSKKPESIQGFVDRKYNKLFTALGDKDPSFLDGVYDLTYKNCSELNASTPDSQLVSYRSVMSKMNSIRSAGFPLNIGYLLNKPYGKGNDGLVTVESGLYGENAKMIEHKGKRGISHGDVIDLFRENIKDFDVREFYVDIVKELKEQGF